MRIVYNLRDQDWQTTKSLGILNVSTRILRGLAEIATIERIDILANLSLASQLESLKNNARCRLHYLASPAPRRLARIAWDHWLLVRICDRLAPDWLLLPKGFSPLLAWPRARVSALVHDNVFKFYAHQDLRPFPWHERFLFRRMLERTARRADVLVTNSAFTASEFAADFRPATAPRRIGAPIEPSSARARIDGTTTPTLLVPTSAWPHKLSSQAIDWLQRWISESGFAGEVHGYGSLPAAGAWPALERWRHHGRISDPAVARLMSADATLIYFSAYEGYGLPPVEAAAAGLRAIASDLPALRETMPPENLFDNGDYRSFALVLGAALSHPPRAPRTIETPHDVAARWFAELRCAQPTGS